MQLIAACLGAFALGTGLGWTSPALPYIAGCKEGTDCDFFFDDDVGSWIGSLFTIGALLSSFVTGYLMSTIGRKWTMISMAVPFVIGWILLLLPDPTDMSPDAARWMFYSGRFITGTRIIPIVQT
jgi:MFS family permease